MCTGLPMCMGAGVHAPSEKRGPCGILYERVLVSALLVSGVGGVHFDACYFSSFRSRTSSKALKNKKRQPGSARAGAGQRHRSHRMPPLTLRSDRSLGDQSGINESRNTRESRFID